MTVLIIEPAIGFSKWAIQDLNKKSQPLENTAFNENSKNEKVHNQVHNSEISPELQQIITAWPELPEHIKAAIKALIQTHSKG